MRPGVVQDYGIPYAAIPVLAAGEDFRLPDGAWLRSDGLTLAPDPKRTVAYLTDTAPLAAYPEDFPPPTLMLHDATFAAGAEQLAGDTGHSTATQAAAFAKTAGAASLLLTHRSVRYGPDETAAMATDARRAFAPTRWAEEGESVEIA